MAPEHLHVDRYAEPGHDLVVLEGELDIYAAAYLRHMVLDEEHSAPRMIVDLSRVRFLDSSGVGALISLNRAARRRGATFSLVCPAGPVRQVLRSMRLDQVFEVRERLELPDGELTA
jgi:anti-sigma B factor antagonist